ncbi:MAG: hypothetical protein ACO2ON_00555 [Candidatus Nanopusillus sp.]
MSNIDITKEFLYTLLILFSIETLLNFISFIIYPSIFPDYINISVKILLFIVFLLSILSIYLIRKDNLYGYMISLFISILILFSAFTLDSDNIISIAVRNVASNYGIYPNPIILFFGISIFLISIRKIIQLRKIKISLT